MKKIANECNDSGQDVNALVGTEIIVNTFCFVFEAFLITFLLIKLCTNHNTIRVIPTKFRLLLCLYHTISLTNYSLFLSIYIPLVFGLDCQIYDYSSILTCNLFQFVILTLGGCNYFILALFWLLRLQSVFANSKYRFSTKSCQVWRTILLVPCLLAILASLIAFIISFDNTGTNNNAFCISKFNVIDFIPYLASHNCYKKQYSYNFMKHNFYTCYIDPNHISSQIAYLGMVQIGVIVPFFNGLLFYLFVKRMKQMRSDHKNLGGELKSINMKMEREQLHHIYLNSIIGITSVSTTMIAFALNIIQSSLFDSLFLLDWLLNGYLMFIVFKFGEQLIPQFFKKMIIKKITRDIDSDSNRTAIELQQVTQA